jgi:hypothetical protein
MFGGRSDGNLHPLPRGSEAKHARANLAVDEHLAIADDPYVAPSHWRE